MNAKSMAQFDKLRRSTAQCIKAILDAGEPGKMYEGTWEILCSYLDAFEDPDCTSGPVYWEIHLHCYLLGPARHYEWSGETFEEALVKCQADVLEWIAEETRLLKEE